MDAGDGLQHFLAARYGWIHALAALDQWAKPVFTLLASPFTAMGPSGMTLFDGLALGGACGCITLMLPAALRWWAWLAPVLLFTCPQVVITLLGGMTEPLFGALAVLLVLLLERHRFHWALALLSLLPFTRPEYVVLIPFAISFTLWHRRWSALPWLLLGTALYCAASWLLLGKPWRLFQEHTYLGNDIYGTGPLLHFWDALPEVLGEPLMWLAGITVIAAAAIAWKLPAHRRELATLTWLSLLPAFGMLALHSYAWWKGGYGSLGLLRVLVCGIPLLVLFIIRVLAIAWRIVLLPKASSWAFRVVWVAVAWWGFAGLLAAVEMPVHADPVQVTIKEAAEFVNTQRAKEERLYYLDPLLGTLCDVDPWDPARMDRQLFGMRYLNEPGGFTAGDVVVWDAHFGPNEGGIPLDTLLLEPRLRWLRRFDPPYPITVLGDHPYAVHVFERADMSHTLIQDTLLSLPDFKHATSFRVDTTACSKVGFRIHGNEFPLEVVGLSALDGEVQDVRLEVRVELADIPASADSIHMVFSDEDDPRSYKAVALGPGVATVQWQPRRAGKSTRQKAYLWNRTSKPFTLRSFVLTRRAITQVAR